MNAKKEVIFTFTEGVDTKTPELVSAEFKLSRLENFMPVFSRIRTLFAHEEFLPLTGEKVRALSFSFNLGFKTLNFYAITNGKVYRLEIGEGLVPSFNQIGTFTWTRDTTVSWASWDETIGGTVYFTRDGTYLQKIQSGVVSEVAATWNDGFDDLKLSAHYCAIVQNRLVLANIKTSADQFYSRRVQWSDLYNPEDFEVVRGKEADFFDLESGNLEVTGLFNHRGYMTIFSRNSIWRASYLGYPKIFQFEPIYSDFGNIYHKAALSVKEVIYFIGDDNFYALDGFTPVPIGDEVWNVWKEVLANTTDDEIPAFADVFNNEVFWKFLRKGDSRYEDYRSADHYWLIVFNYKERRWSFRSPDGIEALYSNRYPLRSFQFIDQFHASWTGDGAYTAPVAIDNVPWDTRTIDGAWQFYDFPQTVLVGRDGDVATYQAGGFTDYLGVPLVAELETQELFFGSFMDSKELSEVKLIYKAVGSPSIQLSVGTRNNQKEDFVWSDSFQQQEITIDNELRFVLNFAIRAKFFKLRLVVTNTTENYVIELAGGALYLTGMKDAGTEV